MWQAVSETFLTSYIHPKHNLKTKCTNLPVSGLSKAFPNTTTQFWRSGRSSSLEYTLGIQKQIWLRSINLPVITQSYSKPAN